MNARDYVAYYRVSTERQGRSGLGLEAQRAAVDHHLAGNGGTMLAEFVEVETGKRSDRPQLAAAIQACRRRKDTLIIAKLDRLARNVAFVASLMETGVPFVAADMPNADRFMLHVYAAMAEEEARRISQRTKAALAAAKARGTVLGANGRTLVERSRADADEFAARMAPIIADLKAEGVTTFRDIAAVLNTRGVQGPRGGAWHLPSVHRLMARLRTADGKSSITATRQ